MPRSAAVRRWNSTMAAALASRLACDSRTSLGHRSSRTSTAATPDRGADRVAGADRRGARSSRHPCGRRGDDDVGRGSDRSDGAMLSGAAQDHAGGDPGGRRDTSRRSRGRCRPDRSSRLVRCRAAVGARPRSSIELGVTRPPGRRRSAPAPRRSSSRGAQSDDVGSVHRHRRPTLAGHCKDYLIPWIRWD